MCVKIMYFEGNVVPKLRKIINFGTTFSVCEREKKLGFRLTAASLTSAGHLTRFSKAFVLQTYVFLLCSIFAQTSLAQIYTIKKRLTFVRRFTKPCDSVGIFTNFVTCKISANYSGYCIIRVSRSHFCHKENY